MNKKLLLLIIVFTQLFLGTVVFAQNQVTPTVNQNNTILTPCKTEKNCYALLEGLPTNDTGELLESIDTTASGSQGIGGFINFIFQIGLGVAGVIGVVMLTVYGFQYAADDKNVQTFAQLKEKILGVVMGLLLLLGIFVILKTINPDLLIVEPKIEVKTFTFNAEDYEGDEIQSISGSPGTVFPPSADLKQRMDALGIYCPGSGGTTAIEKIAKSFNKKVTYRYGGKGTNTNFGKYDLGKTCPGNDTLCIDCSGYAKIVLSCAGLPSRPEGTSQLFDPKIHPEIEKVTKSNFSESGSSVIVNGKELKPGDLIGTPGSHVIVYMGKGLYSESRGGNGKPKNGMVFYSTGTLSGWFKNNPNNTWVKRSS